jgi:hypothetical protein
MKYKLSVKKSTSGIWFLKKNVTVIFGSLDSDERQVFFEDFFSVMSHFVPVFEMPLCESAVVSGYRGKVPASGDRSHNKDQVLLVEGVLSDDETYKEKAEICTSPFSIETNAVYNKSDDSLKTVFYEFSSACVSEYKSMILSCSVKDLLRNPVVRFRNFTCCLEKFSKDGIISKWSGIPSVHEAIECRVHENFLKVKISSDAGIKADELNFERVFQMLFA